MTEDYEHEQHSAIRRVGDRDTVPIRDYMEQLLKEVDKRFIASGQVNQRTLTEAREAINNRLSEMDLRLEQRFMASELRFTESVSAVNAQTLLAFAASHEAIEKANISTDKRFESVNEFRAAYSDLISRFMPRVETESRMSQIEQTVGDRLEKVTEVREQLIVAEGRMVPRQELNVVVGSVNERMDRLDAKIAENSQAVIDLRASSVGQDVGRRASAIAGDRNRYLIFGTISALGTVLALIVGIYFGSHKSSGTTTTYSCPATSTAPAYISPRPC